MTKQNKEQTQFYWHIHHDILCEPLTEPIENRIDYIKTQKSEAERELRLRLLKPVKGKLPVKFVKAWEAWVKAWEAWVKAREAYDKAGEAYDKAGEAYVKAREAYFKAGEARDKAWEARDKAWEAYDKAWEAYVKAGEACKKDIKKLHKKECPNCPWDGRSIFR